MTMIDRSFVSGMLVGGALFGGGLMVSSATQPQDQQAAAPAAHEQVLTAGRIDVLSSASSDRSCDSTLDKVIGKSINGLRIRLAE